MSKASVLVATLFFSDSEYHLTDLFDTLEVLLAPGN